MANTHTKSDENFFAKVTVQSSWAGGWAVCVGAEVGYVGMRAGRHAVSLA